MDIRLSKLGCRPLAMVGLIMVLTACGSSDDGDNNNNGTTVEKQKIFVSVDDPPTRIVVIDPDTRQVTNSFASYGGAFGRTFTLNPSTNRIYFAEYQSGELSIIDPDLESVVGHITMEEGARSTAVNTVTNTIYMTSYLTGGVVVINGATDGVVTTIDLGSDTVYPDTIVVDESSNTVYVAALSDAIYVIDGASNQVVDTIAHSSIDFPYDMVLNPERNELLVASRSGNRLVVIDTTNNEPIVNGNLPLTVTDPWSVALNRATGKYYVTSNSTNSVLVYNSESHALVTSVDLGAGAEPFRVMVEPKTNTIYVSLWGAGSVVTIDGTTDTVSGGPIAVGNEPLGLAAYYYQE